MFIVHLAYTDFYLSGTWKNFIKFMLKKLKIHLPYWHRHQKSYRDKVVKINIQN